MDCFVVQYFSALFSGRTDVDRVMKNVVGNHKQTKGVCLVRKAIFYLFTMVAALNTIDQHKRVLLL